MSLFPKVIFHSVKNVTVTNGKQIRYRGFLFTSHVTTSGQTEQFGNPFTLGLLAFLFSRLLLSMLVEQSLTCSRTEIAINVQKIPDRKTGTHWGCLWKWHGGRSVLSGVVWWWKACKKTRKGRQHSGERVESQTQNTVLLFYHITR